MGSGNGESAGDEAGNEAGDEAGAVRRRRLKFRCWHRGMKEVDLLLGPFADATADHLDGAHLDQFDALLELPDPDILAWVMGETSVPAEHDTPLVRQLLARYR